MKFVDNHFLSLHYSKQLPIVMNALLDFIFTISDNLTNETISATINKIAGRLNYIDRSLSEDDFSIIANQKFSEIQEIMENIVVEPITPSNRYYDNEKCCTLAEIAFKTLQKIKIYPNDLSMWEMFIGDCADLINAAQLIYRGEYNAALKAIGDMDTAARDAVPSSMYTYLHMCNNGPHDVLEIALNHEKTPESYVKLLLIPLQLDNPRIYTIFDFANLSGVVQAILVDDRDEDGKMPRNLIPGKINQLRDAMNGK
jgi:hypothetical protein